MLWLLLYFVAGASGVSAVTAGDLTHHEALDEDGKFVVFWTYDEDQIEFETHVQTRGWLGLGLSPNGGMPGSDIVIGWVKDGQAHLTDRYAVENSLPPEDESQDWELLSGYENDTHTVLRFKRKLQTCDVRDRVINKDTVRLLWAWNDEDPVQDSGPSGPTYHGTNRGARSTMLLWTGVKETTLPDNVLTHDLTMANLIIPAKQTTYWCKIVELPKLDRKHHLIMVSPMITPGNEGMVHHMDFYLCHQPPNMTGIPHDHTGHDCADPNMPSEWNGCFMGSMLATWTIGGLNFMMPDHVGYPMGEDGDTEYVLMQTHYDNPQQKEGVVDHSGIRIHYTPELREYDAGILQVNDNFSPLMVVPPGVQDYRVEALCEPGCLDAFLEELGQPIHIFADVLHGHLLSAKMRTRLIRDGVELPEIARDDNYDFNLQLTRVLEEEVTIHQGDILMTECVYDSRGRDTVTYGGLSTAEEMCQSFLFYYPRMNMTFCGSTVHPLNTLSFMGVEEIDSWNFYVDRMNISIMSPPAMTNMSYLDVVNGISWNNDSVHRFNEHQLKGTYASGCMGRPATMVDWRSLGKERHLPDPESGPPTVNECLDRTTGGSVGIHNDFPITIFITSGLALITSKFF
ncbi:DBH-like monooxygenase protein 1 homolog isoform X2 [Branchiostoma lanceolatum]|uniref:DBH-like monooxygenase protein 1 homolog isoform X2 n=1 Tax=Branchiostoma lanceolatum TaxID=7740 RepID=UPI003453AA11